MIPQTGPADRWPKRLPDLTPEQQRIREDFYRSWLEALPRYDVIERFNQRYPLRTAAPGQRTLEIGCGIGGHLAYEDLSAQREYVGLELDSQLAARIPSRPPVRVVVGDCQERLEFPDGYFDGVLAIHVLEHLPALPSALDEIRRVLRPRGPARGGDSLRGRVGLRARAKPLGAAAVRATIRSEL